MKKGKIGGRMESKTQVDLIEEVFNNIRCLSSTTLSRYKQDTKRFKDWVAAHGDFHNVVSSPGIVNTALQFITHLEGEGLWRSSIKSILASLKFFFAILHERNFIQEDRLKNAKSLRLKADANQDRSSSLVLTDKKFADAKSWVNKKGKLVLKAVFFLLASSGCRANEASHIVIKNINLVERDIFLEVAKLGKMRFVRINDETAAMLEKYIKANKLGENDYLFPGQGRGWIWGRIKEISDGCGHRFSPHSLRWRWFSKLGGMKKEYLRALGGHGQGLTERYKAKDKSDWYLKCSRAYDENRIALV